MKLKPQTYAVLKYNFGKNILFYFKDCYIEDIDFKLILKWQKYIISKNFSNNYNKRLFSYLRTFLNYCVKHYNYNKCVIDDILPFKLKVEKKKSDFYTLDEFNIFISFVDDIVYKTFFNFLFFCGTRPGEAMALRFSDFKDNTISINKTIDSHHNREIGTPKTLSSNRTILLDNNLCNELKNLYKFYKNNYKQDYDFYIFGGLKPLSSTTINRYKKKACELANIRPITLHQFRHSHATLLLNKDIDIHVISKRLGHSKVSTTLNVYTHANLLQEKRVIDTLNSIRF